MYNTGQCDAPCWRSKRTLTPLSTVMSQQLLILEMFIITLVTRLLYRRQYEPVSLAQDAEEKEKMVLSLEATENSA